MLIEPSGWKQFLAELSRQVSGWDISVEVMSEELGDQIEISLAPLSEVTFDPREGVAIAVGYGHQVLRHVIAQPVRLDATEDAGIPLALHVEDAEGTRTLLRLLPPEPLD
jgi:hypothetical protein